VLGQFIVPLSFAALLTGLVQSLGTHWGLFRHYWVLVKFALTIGATILLLLHQFTAVAGAARRVSGSSAGTLPEVGRLETQLVGDAALAVLVLLITTTLLVYKPWGRTSYGRRRQEKLATATHHDPPKMAGTVTRLATPLTPELITSQPPTASAYASRSPRHLRCNRGGVYRAAHRPAEVLRGMVCDQR